MIHFTGSARTAALTAALSLLAAACGDADGADAAGDAGSGSNGAGAGMTTGENTGGSGTGTGSGGDGGAATGGGGTGGDGGRRGVPVSLGSAEGYAILAKSGISNVPTSAVTGDLGVSPAAASYITGFSLTSDSTEAFSTSPEVTGRVYAADYSAPTPSNLTTAVGDMELAFTDAASRAPGVTELGAGDIGGMTLSPGVYAWSTGLLVPTDVTLSGSATDVWIFQIAQDLTVSSHVQIMLAGGARPENVFWQVAGKVVLGTTVSFSGVVLTQTSVALQTGASLHGRLLAQTAVTLEAATITEPTP